MRIGFDAKRLFQNFTGLGNYSRHLVRQLRHQYPENTYHLYTTKSTYKPELADFYNHPNTRVYGPTLPILGSYWRTVELADFLQKHNLSIYHGLSHELPIGISKTGIKSVVTIHDLIFKVYPHLYPFIDRKIYDWKFRYACEQADKIIAISEQTKRDIIQFYQIPAAKIQVIYQSCDQQFYQRTSTKELNNIRQIYQLPPRFLFYVGSIIERKGLLYIVKALHLLPEKERLPLIVIGRGKAYKAKVEAYIKKHHLSKWVRFMQTDFSNLPAFYQLATLTIYPSKYEGFGLPIVESLVCGTPVITSNVSCLPEAAGAGGYLVPPDDATAIAEAIHTLLDNESLYKDLVQRGQQHIQKFEAQKVTTEVMELYQSLQH